MLADDLRALERARIQALLQPDLERLWQLHASDYQLITPSGRSFTRERYLGLIASGDLRYLRWEPGDMAVRGNEHLAMLRYQATLQLGSMPDGPGTPKQVWHTDTYEQRDGVWQAVWSQATEIRP